MKPEQNRVLKCRSCGFRVDRDVNAARNILARGMRFVPVASAIEAMVQEPQRRVILKVDADELPNDNRTLRIRYRGKAYE
jgi:transposase